jgi:hypothetical protein
VLHEVDAFFAAYQAEDVARCMAFFLDAPDTTAIGTAPDEYRVGLPAISALLERDFVSSDAITINFGATRVDVERDTARVLREGTYQLVAGNETVAFPFRLTANLVQTRGRWRFKLMQFSQPVDNPAP